MSTAASLSLLKGAKIAQELDHEDAPAAAETETETPAAAEDGVIEEVVHVEVDDLNAKQLDALVAEHEIEVPDNWSKMKVGDKRAWLKAQFEEDTPAEGAAEGDAPAETPAAEPEAPAETKAVATKKAALKGKIEQPGDDELADLVHEIENMGAKDAREMVAKLANESEMTMFKVGGVLSVIQANGWFEPHGTFRDYIENEVGLHYRKALHWVAIYNALVEAQVPWSKVKGIGWTKLKEIAEVLTPSNVEEWVKIAATQTTLQLIETVKSHKAQGAPKALEDQSSKTVTTKTFKVHADQKETIEAAIEKAKGVSGTTVDTVALEFICIEYLGSKGIVQKLQDLGIEGALELLQKAYPDSSISAEI